MDWREAWRAVLVGLAKKTSMGRSVMDLLKEWGGWVATAIVGFLGLRNGRIDERIELKVKPDEIHKALVRIEKTGSSTLERVIDIGERVSRLEGSVWPAESSDWTRRGLNQ